MEVTFDQAIELLEIIDLSKLQEEDIPALEQKAKKRWHPDRVMHLNNPEITAEYTEKFQQIETACRMINSFLAGTYKAGEAFTESFETDYTEPEEIIRQNAPAMQSKLHDSWPFIKEKKFKWSFREILLSDGFKLRDLLREDFKEDIAMLSIVSFTYGVFFLGVLGLILGLISPVLGTIVAIIWLVQAISCVLGFAPLSRFWLPAPIQDVMLRFINFGLGIYNWAEDQGQNASSPWVLLLVRVPVLIAKLVKYLVLFPLYELAKAIVGDKVVGVVKKKVNYYGDAAEWYIDELILKDPAEMTSDELFHLSYLYTELSDIRAND